MTLEAGLEGMREAVLEAGYGNRVIQSQLLKEHWLSVHSALHNDGGDLVVERSSFIFFPENAVLIKWRYLLMSDPQDRALVLKWVDANPLDQLPPERLDVLVGYLDPTHELRFRPHATCLLQAYVQDPEQA